MRKVKKILPYIRWMPLFFLAFPFVVFMRLIAPFFLIRFQGVIGSRIGHFAANIELYLCEKDAGINIPKQSFIDMFFIEPGPVCNKQLYLMWSRVLKFWPKIILYPIVFVNRIIPGGSSHEFETTSHDRDVHNLLDKSNPHLLFTKEEDRIGKLKLRELGITEGKKFICLTVRDSAYLPDLSYHSYRDGDIQKYVLAAEEMADRGYFVIRMGAKVKEKINSQHPRVIDYATSGMRSEFMDMYLGSKCFFCISTSTGFDAIPSVFRIPLVFITVPVGYIYTFSDKFISITQHHISKIDNHKLSLSEIFENNVGFSMSSDEYKDNGVILVENSSEEILDVVLEMEGRLQGSWKSSEEDIGLQNRFKNIFLYNVNNYHENLHGNFNSYFGAKFLKDNNYFVSSL
jgi:putative glycosyltransferase (TIGR04372 family)